MRSDQVDFFLHFALCILHKQSGLLQQSALFISLPVLSVFFAVSQTLDDVCVREVRT